MWSHESCLKCRRRRWISCLLMGAILGDLHPKVGQDPIGWYLVRLISNTFNLLYFLLFKYNLICFVSFNYNMSLPNDWLRSDPSNPSKRMGAFMPAHLLVTMRYGLGWLALTTKVRFMVWGLPTVGHILQPLCLKLGLLGPIWRISVIGCIH